MMGERVVIPFRLFRQGLCDLRRADPDWQHEPLHEPKVRMGIQQPCPRVGDVVGDAKEHFGRRRSLEPLLQLNVREVIRAQFVAPFAASFPYWRRKAF
jgi:hypothetical protein